MSGRDLPLIEWGEALRRDALKRARRRRWMLLWVPIAGVVLAGALFPPTPRLVWNASVSAPVGLYRVTPGATLRPGDMVVAWMPKSLRYLAATRHYIPDNVPLVKRVAAAPGDSVCALGQEILIDGEWVAMRRVRDGAGRPMPWWTGCRTLREDEFFLLMANVPDSFDGRYFGISAGSEMVGKAQLLWSR